MNLIEQFNAFQEISQIREFSANVRSLYYTILGEFNRLRYPAELKLSNVYLQHLSGITSSKSYYSALNALINAEIIYYQKGKYRLAVIGETLATNRKDLGNTFESNREQIGNSLESNGEVIGNDLESVLRFPYSTPGKKEKDLYKEEEKENLTSSSPTSSRAREAISQNSEAVKQAWFMAEGVYLKGYNALELIGIEKRYGTEKTVQAIKAAALSNTRPRLTLNYVKLFLNEKPTTKEVKPAATPDDWEQAALKKYMKGDV